MELLSEADWHAARGVAATLAGRLQVEVVPVDELDRRVVATAQHALCDLPAFDTSAMDGWAVRGAGPWRIVGDAPAGRRRHSGLERGECVRIATGAVVPTGAEAILRWEDARVEGGVVDGQVTLGRDIRPAGEECRTGELVVEAGTEVTPALAGFLAATGHDEVPVVRRPQVALVLLGDELQDHGLPSDGRVRDSLGPQLPGWIRRAGGEPATRRTVADQPGLVVDALAEVAATADVVITTGGTASGPRDHLHAALQEVGGSLVVDRVAVKPGHPMLLATLPGAAGPVPLIGLPGNPHSAVVGFVTLALPVLDAMLGRRAQELPRIPVAEDLHAPAGHTRLVAGVVRDGAFHLSPYGGSAMLRGLARSRGFAVVPEGMTPRGEVVEWLRLP